MKNYLMFLTSLVIFLSGCSFGDKIDDNLLNRYLKRTYNAPIGKCFDATLGALKEMKTGVEKMDKQKGTIITEKAPFYEELRVAGGNYSATGQSFVASHKYYFKITGNNNRSTVQVVKYRFWQNNKEIDELNASWCNENVWEPLFKEIQNQLDEM